MAGKKKKPENATLPLFDGEWLKTTPKTKPTSAAPKKRKPSKKTKAAAAPQESWQASAKRIIYRGRRSRPYEFEDE